ncbi:hypothetical protein MLAC_34570 [Mycobacterium lacus]|uniref:Lipoprotein LpqN n=1 Tax=Mycobacterium lacus TaxID=169765 RepID=A0A7I7NPH3_9MYCO|nr:hypothetical protein MLAC_34570 [Mycobacterium lacus]
MCAVLGVAGLACLSGSVAAGCHTTPGGMLGGGTASSAAPSSTSAVPKPPSDPAEAVPGIAVTLPDRIPPNALVCLPPRPGDGRAASAEVSDPGAPKITISMPDGWNSSAGTGDTALMLIGPDGMSATVTIAATELEPGGSFLRYTANLGGSMPRLKFSVAGAQFCGYSSELLTMTIQGPAGAIDLADRIAHIWTNSKQYLVAIHLEGPAGAAGFGAAKSRLMQDFGIVIP